MSELTLPVQLETAPATGSLRARMLGKAAGFLSRAAARAEESAAKRALEPVHASTSDSVELAAEFDTTAADPLEQTAGYDFTSDEARAALKSIVARYQEANDRSAQGLPREVNSRAAQKARRAEQKTQREAAYAHRESSLLGIDEAPVADESDSLSKVETEVAETPEQPVYRGRHARAPEVNEQLAMFSLIDDEAESQKVGRHAGAKADESDLGDGLDFSWTEKRSPGEAAALAEAQAETTPKRTVREHIAALKNPVDAARYWHARARSSRSEWVRDLQMPKATEQREKPAGRRRVALAIGSVAGIAVLGAGLWAMSRGHDISAIDASSFELEPITPAGGENLAEQGTQIQPIETPTDTTVATDTASTTPVGGGSRASGAGGASETIGALSGEAIDPGAWNVPKGSGGEALMQRVGADKSVWYEHQNEFLKKFPEEAYRMRDGNVGLKLDDGRLSAKAVEFWKTAIR